MKNKYVLLSIISLIFLGCKGTETETSKQTKYTIQGEEVAGDLYFPWLRIGTLYNDNISSKDEMTKQLDTMSVTVNGAESTLIILYKKLNERGLLYSPIIEVVMENDLHTTWYLTQEDYDTIKTYKLADLKAKKKKVHITADIENIYQNAYKCNKILKIELQNQDGFSISDKWSGGDYE